MPFGQMKAGFYNFLGREGEALWCLGGGAMPVPLVNAGQRAPTDGLPPLLLHRR